MVKKLLLVSLLMTANVAMAHRPMVKHSAPEVKKSELVKEFKKTRDAKALLNGLRADNAPIWRHSHEEAESYFEGNWEFEGSYDWKYDAKGNPIEGAFLDYEGNSSKTTYTYDSNNQQLTSYEVITLNGVEMPVAKSEKKYDEKVVDFTVEIQDFEFDGKDWKETYKSFKRPVNRNEAGNVASMSVFVPYLGKYDEIEKTEITYGQDNKATSFVFSRLGYDQSGNPVWEKEYDIYDIEWDRTDGQLVNDWQKFISGNNRVKKASYYYNGKPDGFRYVTYVDGKDDYTIEETDNENNVMQKVQYQVTDANGSYRLDQWDYFDGGYHYYAIVTYDEKGNIAKLEEYEEMEGNTMQLTGEIYSYQYDAATGAISEMLTEMFNPDKNAYEPMIRVRYSNFIDCAGVEENLAENDLLKCNVSGGVLNVSMPGMSLCEVYSLSGTVVASDRCKDNSEIEVSSLAKGVYIVKATGASSSKSVKLMVK